MRSTPMVRISSRISMLADFSSSSPLLPMRPVESLAAQGACAAKAMATTAIAATARRGARERENFMARQHRGAHRLVGEAAMNLAARVVQCATARGAHPTGDPAACRRSVLRGRLLREGGERVAGQAAQPPIGQPLGAELLVEADGAF